MRWSDVLTDLVKGRDLSADQASWAMGQILAGDALSLIHISEPTRPY